MKWRIWDLLSREFSIFLLTLFVYFLTLNGVWATDHTTSFLQLDFSMWSKHSFVLGQVGSFEPNSVDDFAYKGSYYSALAPGAAFFALPFAGLGFLLDGGFSVFGYATLLTEFTVALLNVVAVLFLYKLLRLYVSEWTSGFIALGYGFSTISWPFATFFFQNDMSAAFDIVAVYFVVRATREDGKNRMAVLAGLSAGAAMLTDYVNTLLALVLLVYLLMPDRTRISQRIQKGLAYLVGPALGGVSILLYNLMCFGNPLLTSEQLYLNSTTTFGGFSTPLYLGVILNIFTPLRGLLFFTPLFVLGFAGVPRLLEGRGIPGKEGLLVFASFLVVFLPYCAWYGPEGGLSFGPRFVIASMPFLFIPAGLVVEGLGRTSTRIAYVLYAIGVVVNGLAAVTTALGPQEGWLTSPFIVSTVPALLNGTLDQWWRGYVGGLWPVVVMLILAIPLLLPLVMRREWRPASEPSEVSIRPHRLESSV